MDQKRLLILGGTKNQLPLILAAKKEGYFVIVCDWTTTNPGIVFADKHIQVSTLDRDAVLKAAIKNSIDGIISNSEPAMKNVAFVAETLNLVGNPLSAIEVLGSKDKFRSLQERLNLYAPKHLVADDEKNFYENIGKIGFPLIIKPVESSASLGTTLLYRNNPILIEKAYAQCKQYSKNQMVSVEEYVEMPSLTLIDGDVFVLENDIFWDGMFFSTRGKNAPMVPMTQSFPLVLPEDQMLIVKESIRKVFNGAGIVHGEFNVEMYFDKNDNLFIIEINPRQGGNGIPGMIQLHCGIDMYKLLVTTSVGDNDYYNELKNVKREIHYVSRQPVFSSKDGKFKGLFIDSSILEYVKNVVELKQKGDRVERVKNAKSVVGFVTLQFPNFQKQHEIVDKIEDLIFPELFE